MKRKLLAGIGWLSGGFLALLALGAIIAGDTAAALAALALAFLVSPLANRYLFSQLQLIVPMWGKILLGILLFFVFADNLTTTEPTAEQAQIEEPAVETQEEVDFPEPETIYYQVASITDGDTIKVVIDDKTEVIRLANINTPETVDPRRPVECLGREASQKMIELVSGKKVELETDETQTDRDRYNRLLRFIFLEDGTDVGLELIKLGFAQSSPYGSSPHKYLEQYEATQKEAQDKELGLWNPSACVVAAPSTPVTPVVVPSPTPASTPTFAPTPTPAPVQKPPANSGGGAAAGAAIPTPQATTATGAYACNCKKTCSQMSSCAEAQYQLNVCGCKARDGDGDGIACDAQCQ